MGVNYTEADYENSVIELFRDKLGYEYIYGPDIERDFYSPYICVADMGRRLAESLATSFCILVFGFISLNQIMRVGVGFLFSLTVCGGSATCGVPPLGICGQRSDVPPPFPLP